MKKWQCQCCGEINEVSTEELDILDEFYCPECGRLYIIEELCDGELSVELF